VLRDSSEPWIILAGVWLVNRFSLLLSVGMFKKKSEQTQAKPESKPESKPERKLSKLRRKSKRVLLVSLKFTGPYSAWLEASMNCPPSVQAVLADLAENPCTLDHRSSEYKCQVRMDDHAYMYVGSLSMQADILENILNCGFRLLSEREKGTAQTSRVTWTFVPVDGSAKSEPAETA
jgi:hypothetical protein